MTTHAMREKAAAVAKGNIGDRATLVAGTVAEIKAGGATPLREIAAALNARSIPTARGGQWSAAQVKRAPERAV